MFGGRTKFFASPRFVLTEVAFEPPHLAVALEGKDVCGNSVEKPSIVADDDGASRERFEGIFERTQCVDIEVVCWLVKKKNVPASLQ